MDHCLGFRFLGIGVKRIHLSGNTRHVDGEFDKRGAEQGCCTLTGFASKDLYEDIVVPATSSSVHCNTFPVSILLKK